jgi:hypothetical protein
MGKREADNKKSIENRWLPARFWSKNTSLLGKMTMVNFSIFLLEL